MKIVTNSNLLEMLNEQINLTPSSCWIRKSFDKFVVNVHRAYKFWDEMTTPPSHLPRTVSSRAWRRHSALISCWEEKYRKSDVL